MIGFELLLAHLVGDYIIQNDWMAKNKVNSFWSGWAGVQGDWACTFHCLFYTLSVWAFAWYWMPWWGLLLCFAVHWPIDRFRLARKWMENVSGQRDFANGVFSPWSIIVVDNIFHLLTLYAIYLIHRGTTNV
jgi:hypothetical protein